MIQHQDQLLKVMHLDTKFQNPEILLQQCLKYIPRENISRLILTKNRIITHTINTTNLATTIQNSFEIFGKDAEMSSLEHRLIRQAPPPHKPPTLSVDIRGIGPTVTDTEAEDKLKLEGALHTEMHKH